MALLCLLTPQDAERLLAVNHANRSIRRNKVEARKRDLERGKWSLVGDAITINTKGQLVSGQHRCTAILETGIAAQVLMLLGQPVSAAIDVDRGVPRTVSDNLGFKGERVTPQGVAMARMFRNTNSGDVLETHDFEEIIRKHRDALEFAEQYLYSGHGTEKYITTSPTGAAIARAHHCGVAVGKLKRWCALINGGNPENDSETRVRELRDFMLKGKLPSGTKPERAEAMRRVMRSINEFVGGPRKRALADEPYPSPFNEEKTA
jgi:hypothetical protein